MKHLQYLQCGAVILSLGLGAARADNTAGINEVLKLKNSGLAEETIVAFVQSKNISYELTADSVLNLQAQGITSPVLHAMLASGRGAPSSSAVLTPAIPSALSVPTAPVAPAAPVYQPAPPPLIPPLGSPQPQAMGQPTVVVQPAFNPDDAYFRQELSPYGRWILTEENEWYWQPTVVVSQTTWRPYWDGGKWVYTDHGWYWASDYPWGWATFHYGRWQLHPHHGWIWYPGKTWGPAWVTWRSGGDYCGWAPLPPHSNFDFASGGFIYRGRHVEASFDFGLDFNHFSFSYVRELGDRPRQHFRQPEEIRRVYNQTTIINNYTVNKTVVNVNGADARGTIVNRGIDPGRVSAVRGRAVEEVKIRDLSAPAPSRAHEHLDAQAKTLEVYRPKLPESPRAQARPDFGGRPDQDGRGRDGRGGPDRTPDRGPEPKRRP